MAIKYKGKDFTELTKKEIAQYLSEKIYMKPKATYRISSKTGKFVRVK